MKSGPRGRFYWLRGWLWCDRDRRNFSMKYPSMALLLSISLCLYSPKWLSITSVSMPSTMVYGKHSTKSVFFPDTHPTKRCHPLLIKSPKIFERPQQLPQNKATERYINEHSLIRQRNYCRTCLLSGGVRQIFPTRETRTVLSLEVPRGAGFE